jgi:ribosomal protein S18 acetylase RimI-like enzyme
VDIDILIGEPAFVGQGVGSQALSVLIARFRRDPLVSFAGLGTSVSNGRAIRAFEKAGFRLFRKFQDPESGLCRYMLVEVRPSNPGMQRTRYARR